MRHLLCVLIVAANIVGCVKKSDNSGAATREAAEATQRASAGVRAAGEQLQSTSPVASDVAQTMPTSVTKKD